MLWERPWCQLQPWQATVVEGASSADLHNSPNVEWRCTCLCFTQEIAAKLTELNGTRVADTFRAACLIQAGMLDKKRAERQGPIAKRLRAAPADQPLQPSPGLFELATSLQTQVGAHDCGSKPLATVACRQCLLPMAAACLVIAC